MCVYAVEVAAACSNAAEDDTGDGGQMHSSEAKPPLAYGLSCYILLCDCNDHMKYRTVMAHAYTWQC